MYYSTQGLIVMKKKKKEVVGGDPRCRCAPLALRCAVEAAPGSEAGWYLRLIDSCIIEHKAQGPSRTCNESKEEKEEEEEEEAAPGEGLGLRMFDVLCDPPSKLRLVFVLGGLGSGIFGGGV